LPYVEKSIIIQGDPDEVYLLAKDMEKFPDFMPDVQSVTVTRREDSMTLTDWVTEIDGTEILWTEEDRFDDVRRRIQYRLLEGDLDKFEGEWRFDPVDEGTRVVLTVDFDFGIPELVNLIGDILTLKVGENSEMMLKSMKDRVEGKAGAP
jgi:ribosome-associated toxin RatA of RatAB toxin-antitoxin module